MKTRIFSVSTIFLCFHAGVLVCALSHAEKVDKISEAYMSLKGVVDSLINVHSAVQETAENSDEDFSTLTDSKTRNEYEIAIMKVEDAKMRAAAAKRSDVTEEELHDAALRGEAINKADELVKDLDTKITDAKNDVNQVNDRMAKSTLSDEDLKAIEDQANADADPDERITLPKTCDIKAKVDEQISSMQAVIQTVSDESIKKEAIRLKENIDKNFGILLNDQSTETVAQRMQTAKEIDISLLHFKELDLYGSASRMEL